MSTSLLLTTAPAELLPLEHVLDAEYPSALREIATCLYLHLRTQPVVSDDTQAAHIALALTEGLRREIGGGQIYVPKGDEYELTARDREILDRFNGHNHEQLAREYDVTTRHIYRLLQRRIREEVKRRQAALPL
ncbi:hypothetical protein GO613_12690 [Azoarcus communis]|uniref:Mor transcription activator family protein n=1 Tax=Parazoarcus communis TaxID=41977 RepID=UPI00145930F0|nr:Mor transcription activator family protein [Parazoarcus communis]NMG48958.1 hypothetical protein [Parazoarcus communis]